MLQILTYMFAFYLVIKGIQVFQTAWCSSLSNKTGQLALGAITLIACVFGAVAFSVMQNKQVSSMGAGGLLSGMVSPSASGPSASAETDVTTTTAPGDETSANTTTTIENGDGTFSSATSPSRMRHHHHH